MAYIKINRENYFHNLELLAAKAGSREKIAVVLKDNAYGHGLEIMAQLAAEFGISEAVVISLDEAEAIKEYFGNILILDDISAAKSGFSYAVTETVQLEKVESDVSIELKVDTGMHRNGISMNDMEKAIELIKRRGLSLKGVMTHYRSADELSSEYFWQKKRFERVVGSFKKDFHGLRFHSCNSAALLRGESFDEDIARTGIATYGYSCLPECFGEFDLRPVMQLWARRVSTRKLKKGERVGYGGDYEAERDMTVSTYDLGYGHGWPRGDAGRAYRIPDGRPLLGRVSMDFISVEGNDEEICVMDDARQAAEHFSTISYEMTTSLRSDIERRIV